VKANKYMIGEDYVDKANPSKEEDQFLRWIRGPLPKGIGNAGGVRRITSHSGPRKGETTCVVIVSNKQRRPSGLDNPWQDQMDIENGSIEYWGDSRLEGNKNFDEYQGNRLLMDWYLKGQVRKERDEVPPILYFQKPRRGKVTFCGLVIIREVEINRFLEDGKPVPNYLFHLDILNEDEVQLGWIHDRTSKGNDAKAPGSWKKWVKTGEIDKYSVWKKSVKSKTEQLPSDDNGKAALRSMVEELSWREFEYMVEFIMARSRRFNQVKVTPPSRDKGYDLTGRVAIPEINFSIDFYLEAKKWKGSVGVKDVSRLASRLGTGTFGIFVTTSYFTKQAQEETFASYPIKLIPGGELLTMSMRSGLVKKDGSLNEKIKEEIKKAAHGPSF